MQPKTEAEKVQFIMEYLREAKKVNARYSLSKSQVPVVFIAWVQQGLVAFKNLLSEHIYDPGGFYVVELEYAYQRVVKRVKEKEKKVSVLSSSLSAPTAKQNAQLSRMLAIPPKSNLVEVSL